MLELRKSSDRGVARFNWLESRHTFSFGSYDDPKHQGFSDLLVINDDRVQPGTGFDTHSHRDMEIFTYVLQGALEHKDSTGTGSVVRPGDVQLMTAGSGIRHSEFNPSESEPVHFYQIWLLPDQEGLAPSYDQRAFPEEERRGKLRVVASPGGRDGSLTIHQDAEVLLTSLTAGERVTHELAPGRHAWLQILRGSAQLNGVSLATSDGAAVSDESSLVVLATEPCEVMLFDLP